MRHGSLSVILLSAVILACAPPEEGAMAEADEAADIAAVEAVMVAEMNSLMAGDAAANAALLTDDAVIMAPGWPAVPRAEAEMFFAGWLEEYTVTDLGYLSHDSSIDGDIAIDRFVGRMTTTHRESGETETETLKGIHVLERQADGSWKIAIDVWNETPADDEGEI